MSDDELRHKLTALFLAGNTEAGVAMTRSALDSGLGTGDFFNHVFTPTLKEIGDRFGRLEIYLAELVEAAETAKAISEQVIRPGISPDSSEISLSRGKVVICSMQGDIDDIGDAHLIIVGGGSVNQLWADEIDAAGYAADAAAAVELCQEPMDP